MEYCIIRSYVTH